MRLAVAIEVAGPVDETASMIIKGRVAENARPSLLAKPGQQLVNHRILILADRLNAGRIVDVDNGLQILISNLLKVEHVRRWSTPVEVLLNIFFKTDGRDRPKILTLLYLVEARLHLTPERRCQQRSVAQRPGTDFAATVRPGHDMAVD
jgi:hypothetical protein